MNKKQKAIDQMIRSDLGPTYLSYKSLKKILSNITRKWSLKEMIEWKDHHKGYRS